MTRTAMTRRARMRRPSLDAPDMRLPPAFLPAVRALLDEQPEVEVVAGAAADYAQGGQELSTLLDDLEASYRALGRSRPTGELVRAACEAWADAAMRPAHTLASEGPQPSPATLGHVAVWSAELESARPSGRHRAQPSAYDSGLLLLVISLSNVPHVLAGTNSADIPPALEGRVLQPERALALLRGIVHRVAPDADAIAVAGRDAVLAIATVADCTEARLDDLNDRLARCFGPAHVVVQGPFPT